jgi:hypothetical protein
MTEEKVIYLIKEIARENKLENTLAVLENSTVTFQTYRDPLNYVETSYVVFFKINPITFVKINTQITSAQNTIKRLLKETTGLSIYQVSIAPDYDKISVINSEASVIQTEWEEINDLQKKLVDLFKKSDGSIDYQNIGNSARTLMDKLARIVFDEKLHKPEDPKIDVRNGKFKNQLHSYIATKLKGSQNEDIRKLANASIEFMEKSIDLMNVTTHKLDVQKHFAELCIISLINVISVIKSINEIP